MRIVHPYKNQIKAQRSGFDLKEEEQ